MMLPADWLLLAADSAPAKLIVTNSDCEHKIELTQNLCSLKLLGHFHFGLTYQLIYFSL